jgi:hypothetical protein
VTAKKDTEEISIGTVTKALWDVYHGLKDKGVDARVAGEMTNALGKLIKSRAAQLEYFSLRKEKPDIDFWKEPAK